MKKLETKHKFTTLALLAATPGLAIASPQGGDVVAGAATISTPTPQGTVIDQSSAKAIINWQSFSIGASEYVQFNQPDASSVSLNRVVGVDPSVILGNLSANGQVFLVNPNGVLFGAGATLDVGGLVASTSSINDDDFLNGNYIFTSAANAAGNSVVNAGVIQARESGYVVLIGERVENSGSIETKFGQIALLAGGEVTLDIGGDGLLSYSIDSAAATELAGVENTGSLIADGGRVILAGKVSDDLIATAVNNSGLIQANGIEERNGEIYLTGSGDVYNRGTISASGETGGTISIHGTRVAQQGEVHADGSVGDGGDISITADEVIALTNGSVTTANAGTNGNGGDVIAYTEGSALLRDGALIEAKGGSESGDGGFVEVSGIQHIEINGDVDASATNGAAGTFLIDPTDINIVSSDDAMVADLVSGGGDPDIFTTNTDNTNEILDTAIETLLNGGTSVTLQTTNAMNADDGGGAGDITVDAEINTNVTGGDTDATLTLIADQDIILKQDIINSGGTLNVDLQAGNDINLDADIDTNDGVVSITATVGAITMDDGSEIKAGSGAVTLSAGTHVAIAQIDTTSTVNITATAGEITDAQTSGDGSGDENITGGTVTLFAGMGIGVNGSDLDTDVTTSLSATTATGGINIVDSGSLTVSSASTTTSGSVVINADSGLTTSGAISTAGDGDINLSANDSVSIEGTITANGSGTVDIDASGTNSDVSIAATITSATGNVTITADDSVDFTAMGGITSTSGDVAVTANNDLATGADGGDAIKMVDGAVINAGSGKIELDADGTVTVGRLITTDTSETSIQLTSDRGAIADTVDTGGADVISDGRLVIKSETGVADIETDIASLDVTNDGSGDVVITEANDLTIENIVQSTAGNINVSTTMGSITVDDGGGGANDVIKTAASGTIDLNAGGSGSNINLSDRIQSGSGQITLVAANNVDFQDNGKLSSTSGDVSATATAGAIVDNNGTDEDISAATVTLSAATGIATSVDPLETDATTLSLSSTTGGIYISEKDAVTISNAVASAGNINITAAGDITISDGDDGADSTVIQVAGSSTIQLDATGSNNDIDVRDGLLSITGNIDLNADDSISFTDGGNITSTSGVVTITADANNNTNGNDNDSITMATGTVIDAGSGAIVLDSDGDVALGKLTTMGAVDVNATTGEITDANDDTDANNITGSVVTLTAADGIGDGNALETAATTSLEISVTGTGDIDIAQTGGVDLAGIDTDDGDISISASGAITTSAAITAIDGDLSLTTSGDSNITLSNAVMATTNGGDVSLTITAGGAGALTQNAGATITADANASGDSATLSLGGETISLNDSVKVEIEDRSVSDTAQLNINAGSGGLTTTGTLLANVINNGDASVNITSAGSTTIGNTVTANVVDDGTASVSIDSATTTTVNAAILAEAGGSSSNGNASVTLDGDIAVDINNTVTAHADDNGNATVSIGGTGALTIDATVSSMVGGDGNALIDIGSMGAEVASVTIGATGSLDLTEGSAGGDSETLAIYAAGNINTNGVALNANDGITLSAGSINVADLTADTGSVNVAADTGDIVVTVVDADVISITNTDMISGNITTGQLDAGSGGITVNAAGALSTTMNTVMATGAINLDADSISTGAINSSGSSVDVDAIVTSIDVGAVDADSSITLNAETDLNAGNINSTNSTVNVDSNTSLVTLGTVDADSSITLNAETDLNAGNINSVNSTVDVDSNTGAVVLGTVAADDNVTVSASSSLNVGDITVTADDVSLTAGGALTLADITNANNISLSAVGSVATSATNPYAATSITLGGTGAIYNLITDTAQLNLMTGIDSLTINNSDTTLGVSGALSATGNIDIDSGNGDLTINNALSAPTTLALAGAAIDSSATTLSGDTGLTITGDSINAGALNATTGAVTVTANTADVVTKSITANSISITANNMANGEITTEALTTDVGAISLVSEGDVSTGTSTVNSATTVLLDGANVTAGDIIGTAVILDGAVISAGAVTTASLTVQNGAGNATNLTLSDTLTTNANITVDGSLSLQGVSATSGITLNADDVSTGALTTTMGAISVSSMTGALGTGSISGSNISLTANGGTGSITTGQLDADSGGITAATTGALSTGNVNALLAAGAIVNLTGDTVSAGDISTNATTGTVNVTATAASGTDTINIGDVIASAVNFDAFSITANAITANSFTVQDENGVGNANDLTLNGTLQANAVNLTIENTLVLQDVLATTGNLLLTSTSGAINSGDLTSTSGLVDVNASGQYTLVGDINAAMGITLLAGDIDGSVNGDLTTTSGNISVESTGTDVELNDLTVVSGIGNISIVGAGEAKFNNLTTDSGTSSVTASSLVLEGAYTDGTFSAENSLTLASMGSITNSNVLLTGADVIVDGTIDAMATGAEQNASVTINATNDISINGTVNVSSQSGNATFTATADSDSTGNGAFNQSASGAVTVTASNIPLGSPIPESGTGNASINIMAANVQQLGSLTSNASNGISADLFPLPLPLIGSFYAQTGTVTNQSTITLTSTAGSVETNSITSNYSVSGGIAGTETVSINSAAGVTVGGTIQTSNTLSTESVSIMAAGNVVGAGSISSDSVSISTTGDIGVDVANRLALNAATVNVSGALDNAYLNLTATNSTLNVNSSVTNTLDIDAVNLNLSGSAVVTAQDINVTTMNNLDLSQSLLSRNLMTGNHSITLNVGNTANNGSYNVTTEELNLAGTGSFGATLTPFNVDATTVDISNSVASVVLDNAATADSTLNLSGGGTHGSLDVSAGGKVSLTAAGADINVTALSLDTTGALSIEENVSSSGTLNLQANGIDSKTAMKTLTASVIDLSGTGTSNIDVLTNAATVVLGTGLANVDIDNGANTAATVFNFGAVNYGAVTLAAGGDTSFAGSNITTSGDVDVMSAGALNANRSISVNTGSDANLSLSASGTLMQAVGSNLIATAGSNADDSATVTLAGANIVQDGRVIAKGGGSGGTNTIDLDSATGNIEASFLRVRAANGNDAVIDVNANGALTLDTNSSSGKAFANANGGNNANINLTAGTTITQNVNNLARTAAGGASDINVNAGGAVQLNGSVDADNVAGTSTIDVMGSSYTGTAVLDANSVAVTTTGGAIDARTRAGDITLDGTNTLTLDNTAFTGATTFNYTDSNYNTLDLSFGGNTSLLGGNITANTVSISSNGGLALNQGYTATSAINLTAGGQVTAGMLNTPMLNLAGNGGANFGMSGENQKLLTNADTVDLGAGINNVFVKNTRTDGTVLNFSGTNYGIVDFDFTGSSIKDSPSTSTSRVTGNDFSALALAISTNGNLIVNNGFDVRGGTVPGVEGDTLLTAAIASVSGFISDGGSSDPNASFIATDSLTLNVSNLKQSNQYLFIKADNVDLTGVSNAANLLVQLTPFSLTEKDVLGNTVIGLDGEPVFNSLSLNQTAASGTADFNYGFEEHFAPFTGTTIALGEQGFNGDISVGSINAGTKNLLLLSGGTISGLDNIIGTGLLGTADEVGGLFVVRPIVTTITADQLGAFGFKLGARVSTIELNGGFDAAGKEGTNRDDLELKDGGVNDGSEKQCS